MTNLLQNRRYALRRLRRNPQLHGPGRALLALDINARVFSLSKQVLLAWRPAADPAC